MTDTHRSRHPAPRIVGEVIRSKGTDWNEATQTVARSDAERVLEALVAEYGIDASVAALDRQGFRGASIRYLLQPLFAEATARRARNRSSPQAISDLKIEQAPTTETDARQREVQLLINIVQPDPEYQPFFLSDEASLSDAVGTETEDMQRRLATYFGAQLAVNWDAPLFQLVDAIRAVRPEWPEDM